MSRIASIVFGALAVLFAAAPASAQSGCSYIAPGAVLTAGQWQFCFQQKQDVLGFVPLGPTNLVGTAPVVVTPSAGVVTISLGVDSSLAVGGGVLGINLTHGNTWSALQAFSGGITAAGDALFGSGRPWCDPRAHGATATAGTTNTDDTAAFNACQTAMLTGGDIRVTNGSYCLTSGFVINTSGIHLVGESKNSTKLLACGGDVNVISTSGSLKNVAVKELEIDGKGTPNDPNDSTFAATKSTILFNGCSGCRIDDAIIYGGLHNILTNSLIYMSYVVGGYAYGSLMALSGGAFINDSSADQAWPFSPAALSAASISAYANTTGYTAGQIVTSGGYYIIAMTSGTSAGAGSPTLLNYGQTITDANTLTWQLANKTNSSLWSFAGSGTEYYSKFIDATGAADDGITVSNGAAFKCYACLASQTINAPVTLTGGALVEFADLTTGYPVLTSVGGIVATSGFAGFLNVIGGQIEGDYGLNIGGGHFALVGAKVLATNHDGVFLANNITGYTISANNFSVGGNCVTFGTGNNSGTFVNNVCNGAPISGTPGTSTAVYGNDGSPVPIGNGGTGQATQQAAFDALGPTATRAGDVIYWSGTHYVTLAGNNSGSAGLQENSSGVPSWVVGAGTGSVTSIVIASTGGATVSGTCTITTTGTCVIASPGGFLNVLRNASLAAWFHGCVGSACTITTAGGWCAEGVWVVPTGASVTCQQVPTTINGKPIFAMKVTGAASVTDVKMRFVVESLSAGLLSSAVSTFQLYWTNNSGSNITPTLATRYATGGTDNWSSSSPDLAATNLQTCNNTVTCNPAYALSVSNNAGAGYEYVVDFGNNFGNASNTLSIEGFDARATPGVSTGLVTSASPIEARDPESDIRWNERFYQTSYDNGVATATATHVGIIGMSGVASTNNGEGGISFKTLMRCDPSVSIWDGAGNANKASYWNGSSWTDNFGSPAVVSGSPGNNGFVLYNNQAGNHSFHYAADCTISGG